MTTLQQIVSFLIFPGGLFVVVSGLLYQWIYRKLVARLQNRIGPRWFQPFADILKLLAKEEVTPQGVDRFLFVFLPICGLAGALTAALYVPIASAAPAHSFRGDLVATLYLLSLPTLCMGIAGANSRGRFSVIGATRTLTQTFSYEAPFLLALVGPALVVESWQISQIANYAEGHTWFVLTQPIGFLVALVGLMGKLELPPFDAPEAETEIVAGALTEYGGRGLAIFNLGKAVEMIVGMALIATLYLGGAPNLLIFLIKTLILVLVLAMLQSLLTRLRIDQVVRWWRYFALLALGQTMVLAIYLLVTKSAL